MVSNFKKLLGSACHQWVRFILLSLAGITIFCLFNPFSPVMPSKVALDPSWVIGLNQAVAQQMQFGREIIFTFGPYAAIYTKAFHPATENRELIGSLFLALLYITSFILVMRHAHVGIILGFCLLISVFTTHLDALFFSYALLIAIYCWSSVNNSQSVGTRDSWKTALILTILFSGFGLYPLIKGPHFFLFLLIAFLSIAVFLSHRKWLEAIAIFLSTSGTLALFWKLAHQNHTGLLDYFSNQILLTMGFAQAMSNPGSLWEVVVYVVIAIAMLFSIVKKAPKQKSNFYIVACFSLYLFVAFKAGFTRHDGHALMAGDALLIAAMLIVTTWPTRTSWIILLSSGLFFIALENHYQPNIWQHAFKKALNFYERPWQAMQNYSVYRQQSHSQFTQTLKILAKENSIPKISGTSDIFPFDQTELIASGNTWHPRPVFQSYHAYTKTLANLNAAFLASPNAPDHLFFRIESIDERFPSGDDGASWPILLSYYEPSGHAGKYLVLQKKKVEPIATEFINLSSKSYPFTAWVELPITKEHQKNLYASIDVKPNLLGRIKNLLYKSSPLGIGVKLADGSIKQFRLIPGNSDHPFLLSPLIENATEFGELYSQNSGATLQSKRVTAISVWVEGNPRDWQPHYQLNLQTAH